MLLVDGVVAVLLEGAARGAASPGPAVVPGLPPAAGAAAAPPGPGVVLSWRGAGGGAAAPAGAVVAPPLAAPERWYASHSAREMLPSPFLSMAEKSGAPRPMLLLLDDAPAELPRELAGDLGSPAVRGVATPPVGPVPVLLAPEGGA